MTRADGMHDAELAVRRATAGDIGALVEVMEEFHAESGYVLDRAWAASSFADLLSTPAWGCVWLACHDGTPIGHAVLTVRYTMEHGGLSGYVDDLFVRPAFRRRGVARSLLGELFGECRARRCKSVQVEVGQGNAAALGAYAEFGLLPLQDGRLLLCGAVSDVRT
jgi:GNAT superfamily N-acetyltransferase